MLCDDLEEASEVGGEGRLRRQGRYIYIYTHTHTHIYIYKMADSFSCTAETNTIL